jgi:hypothetical protein
VEQPSLGGEAICNLILSRNKPDIKLLASNSFSNKEKINLNMLSASMKNWISRQVGGTKIITP